MHITKRDILAGVHVQNSIVERRIKEVSRLLRDILFHTKTRDKWSEALPLVQRIMNSQRMEPIGTSPAQIIYENSVNLDSGVILSDDPTRARASNDSSKRLSEWTSSTLQMQESVIQIARQIKAKHHEKYFNSFTDERTTFPVNSYVLVNYGDQQKPRKLHPHWRGPYRVVAIDAEDPNRYTAQNLVTGKLEDFPVHQLKTFLENNVDSPEDVATTDDALLHVAERILSHEGNRKNPSSLRFRVQWADGSEASLEKYSAPKNNSTLHEYLTALGDDWPALVPIEFTNEVEHYTETHPQQPTRQRQTEKRKITFSEEIPTRTSKRLKKSD